MSSAGGPGRAPGAGAPGGGAVGRRRRRWLPPALLVAFVVLPLIEIVVIIQVGSVIGAWWTVLLLVADSLVGAWLVRREGARAFRALQEALRRGAVPGREIADGALILVGGTLMLTPGFVTDVLGIALVLPFTRPLFRGALTQAVTRRIVVGGGTGGPAGPMGPMGFGGAAGSGGSGPGSAAGPGRQDPGPGPEGPVVRGEVVDDEP